MPDVGGHAAAIVTAIGFGGDKRMCKANIEKKI